MKTNSMSTRIATLLTAAAGAACVPVPMHVYVADGTVGSLVYAFQRRLIAAVFVINC